MKRLWGIAIPLVALVVIGYISYEFAQVSVDKESWVSHTNTVIKKLDYLLSNLIDAESGMRGYVISDNATFLGPYNVVLDNYQNQLQELKTLTSDNQVQQQNLEKLQPLIEKSLALSQQMILEKNQGLSMDNANNTMEKDTMDAIKKVIVGMQNEENDLLTNRLSAYDESAQEIGFITLYGTTLIAVITGLVIFFIIRNVRNHNRTIAEELEKKIHERTASLEAANKKLIQNEKSKDEFITMISHELKTPLVPIKGYVDILLSQQTGILDENQRRQLKIVKSSSESLLRLISDLLDAQKIEIGQLTLDLKICALSDIINEVVLEFNHDANNRGIVITTNLQKNMTCLCDKTRIGQVLSNLISNAMDFCPKEGGKIDLVLKRSEKYNEITVSDNGVGIPADKIHKIFVKFYQIDTSITREHGGTGLGLSICKGIVENHGGKIWAESEGRGKGTKIHILLPFNG